MIREIVLPLCVLALALPACGGKASLSIPVDGGADGLAAQDLAASSCVSAGGTCLPFSHACLLAGAGKMYDCGSTEAYCCLPPTVCALPPNEIGCGLDAAVDCSIYGAQCDSDAKVCICHAAICTPGVDHTCNDDISMASIAGECRDSGYCQCNPGFEVNPETLKCRIAR